MRICVDCHHSNPDTYTQCEACGGALALPEGTVLRGRLRRYRVDRVLGVGGFGVTYLTTEVPTDRPVVIKELQARHIHDLKVKELFEREAQALAVLDPAQGVPDIFDFFYSQDRRAYLVMEYVAGETLADFVARRRTLSEEEAVDIGLKVVRVLAYLHRQGVIHRDVKPGNIMRRPDGSVTLIDFGAVKQAVSVRVTTGGRVTSTMIATPGYAPPEQARGLSVDQTADLFGLGATLIHLLTGIHPIDLVNPQTGDFEWRGGVQVDEGLARVIEKATTYRPVDRYQSAEEMSRDLEAMAGEISTQPSEPITLEKPSREEMKEPKSPSPPKHPPPVPVWIWALGGLAVLALVMGVVMALKGGRRQPAIGTTSAAAVVVARATSTIAPTSMPAATSPDNKSLEPYLTFVSDRDGKQEIYRLNGVGEVVQVTNTSGNGESWGPALSPDGTLFFTSDRDGKLEIYRLTAAGEVVQVTNTPGNGESWGPDLAPDGTLSFTSDRDGKREIYRLNGAGEVIQVTRTLGNGESWEPDLAPDGTLFFTSDRDGRREIYRLNGAGEVIQVTRTLGNGESWGPALAPDGTLSFTSDRDGKREIYRLNGAGEVIQVTRTLGNGESWGPALVPDGTFSFTSDRDGKREIYRLNGAGEVIQVTNTSGNGKSLGPSPVEELCTFGFRGKGMLRRRNAILIFRDRSKRR